MAGKVRAKILAARSSALKSRVETLLRSASTVTSDDAELFLTQIADLNEVKNTYEEVTLELEEVRAELEEGYTPSFECINQFSDMIDKIRVVANKLGPSSVGARPSLNSTQGPAICRVKLEPIRLMNFDGSPENWNPFFQQFLELIDQNPDLSDLQRMTYLVSHLTGSARSIVAGIPPVEANYEFLKNTLKDRFEDKRALGHYYLDKILNFKPITQESERNLNNFLEEFVGATEAIKKLAINDLFDFFLVYLSTKKLDPDTIRHFDMHHRDLDVPTFETVINFVRAQTRILARSKKLVVSSQVSSKSNSGPKSSHAFLAQQGDNSVKLRPKNEKYCPCCHQSVLHSLEKCSAFLKFNPVQRYGFIKSSHRCFRCLLRHFAKNCNSRTLCNLCQRPHHVLLHFVEPASQSSSTPANSISSPRNLEDESSPPVTVTTARTQSRFTTVLLATAQVIVLDRFEQPVTVRALLDNGSQSHFVQKGLCEKLGITPRCHQTVVRCLGNNSSSTKGQVSLRVRSRISSDVDFEIDALVMEDLTGCLPAVPVDVSCLSHLEGLELADEVFSVPGPIDILIGAELWPQICGSRKVVGSPGQPYCLESSLGWLVMGPAPVNSYVGSSTFTTLREDPIDELLEKFWAIEEAPSVSIASPEDENCESIFCDTVTRMPDGRFMVALPFRLSPSLLGDSFRLATQRFLSLERRLLKQPELHLQYGKVIKEYLNDNYLTRITSANLDFSEGAYYIPHHGVLKPDSSTTPLRIVLNASARTTTKLSLNDVLYVGPKLQNDLVLVLLNFRLFEYALSADVRQMYLRIMVRPQDRRFQRIVWRFSPEEDLQIYEMNTVVFGVAPSPYLALRVVKELIRLEGHRYPLAAISASRDTYVDDYLTSTPTTAEASLLLPQMIDMFAAGSFTLAKWASNSVSVMSSIPENLRSSECLDFDSDCSLKVLGLKWNPHRDVFQVKVNVPSEDCTKRAMLSAVARIFDPLGFLAPLTIVAKGFIRSLWSQQLGWDDTPSELLCRQWRDFVKELNFLKDWSIPRHSFISPGNWSALVGFADASQIAYGAVVYSLSDNFGTCRVSLLVSKSKIAPLKTTCIPRLELCAAVLLSSLLRYVMNAYSDRHEFSEVFALSDSTVALHWLSSSPSRWKVFVANRVTKIQRNTDVKSWHHVRGEQNPADCLSRGLSAGALLRDKMWFSGPPWIVSPPSEWPITPVGHLNTPIHPTEENIVSLATTTHPDWILAPLLQRVSSFRKLLRTTAYVFRFLRRSRLRAGPLHLSEIVNAETLWLRHTQMLYFRDILDYLESTSKKRRKRLTRDPLIGKLDLFLKDGVIRVGGRLQYSRMSYDQRHPVLLPKVGKFVELLVDQYHKDNLHTGPHILLSLLNLKYWILSGRSLVRQRVHKCNWCFRAKPRALEPKMAPLPSVRFQQHKAFLHCGVDYAGPFAISMVRRRGGTSMKAYVCVFVCLSTKALHFELVSTLSTEGFLAALRRFLSRRGPCKVLCSDQGTNFLGAKHQLDSLYALTASNEFNSSLSDELSNRGIEWRLNPPSSPHFGGIWERSIQSFKSLLYKLIGPHLLTYEEFNTVIIQIEAVLNSRPLTVLSADPNGPTALTPAHFLTLGPPLDRIPFEDTTAIPSNRLDHHQRISQIVQGFWKRWQQEYLHTLQARTKWTEDTPPMKVGSVVVVMQENTPPLQWPLAVVEEICGGPDGIARIARLRTSRGELTRPLVKLCPLPCQ